METLQIVAHVSIVSLVHELFFTTKSAARPVLVHNMEAIQAAL